MTFELWGPQRHRTRESSGAKPGARTGATPGASAPPQTLAASIFFFSWLRRTSLSLIRFTSSCSVLATSFCRHRSRCHWPEARGGGLRPPAHLFAEPLGLDGDGFVRPMFLQDADGADAALAYPTVHLQVKAARLSPA